jgi:hypothetical protein
MWRRFLRFFIFSFLMIFFFYPAKGQKEVSARRIAENVVIEGKLEESFWKEISPASGFYQYAPYVKHGEARFRTEVRFAYDDDAVYVGAKLYDPHPDSLLKELSVRDNLKNASYFSVFFDPYNDAKNASGFGVTASGVQFDIKSTEEGSKDYSWDGVWESAVNIDEEGWTAEFRIPYSALRIPQQQDGRWGLQIQRLIRRYREEVVWNPMDPQKDGFNNQFGTLTGIRDITPPLRLSLMPYLSGYADYNAQKNTRDYRYKGGMDMKLGINESFTLDMILIPDFGQVQSDDRVVNLSPYEQYYDEKRAFFMEGTELFSKGDIFYSRRIGSSPINYSAAEDSLRTGEVVRDNPSEPQLINATKLSGKTSAGLGVGVINAMTAKTTATLRDTITGETRTTETGPFTNYNMMVVDKALNKNSYVSFANTNVYRGSDYYTANVSAIDFKLTDTTNTWSVSGIGAVSQKYKPDIENTFGHRYWLKVGKISGNFTFNLQHLVESNTYDPNDMGYLSSNNDLANILNIYYNKYERTATYLSWRNRIRFYYAQQYKPREFVSFDIWAQSFITLPSHLTISLNSYIKPVPSNDFNEPRHAGWKYESPAYYEVGGMLSPDYRNPFLVDVSWLYAKAPEDNRRRYEIEIKPRARLSDKLTLIHELELENDRNKVGYVTSEQHNNNLRIIFGKRVIDNITNTLDATYIFNEKSALSLRLRHYWMRVKYNRYYTLKKSGELDIFDHQKVEDFSANIFNIDMAYSWRFAPGSELSIVYKNEVYNQEQEAVSGYFNNLNRTINAPGTNSLSLKVLYYIDYDQVFNRNQS